MQKSMIREEELSTPMGYRELYELMLTELAEKGVAKTISGTFSKETVDHLGHQRQRILVQEYQAWKICRVLFRVWEREYPTGHELAWLHSEYFLRKMHCAARGAVCDNSLTMYYQLLGLDFSMLELFRILGTLGGCLQPENGAVPAEDMAALKKIYSEYPIFLEPVEDWRSLPDSEIPEDDKPLVQALKEGNETLAMRLSLLNKMEMLGLLTLALTTHTPPVSI